jgi:hypothetical protein
MPSSESERLKVPPEATLEEIKKAFRRQALAVHPDHNPDPEASRHFRRLTEAYRRLEAQALLRQAPTRSRKPVPLSDRVSFVLADIRSMVKRWPAHRWSRVVDGLPAGIWLASVLEVLARHWPAPPPCGPVEPTRDGIAEALEQWEVRRVSDLLPEAPSRARSLLNAVQAAETRIRSLDGPPGRF